MITVPIMLDHNRMLVKAEIQKTDGSWRETLLWVDTGNPDFFISESLAIDLGIDLSEAPNKLKNGKLEVANPTNIRMGGMTLNFSGVTTRVVFTPTWLFTVMHVEANLPSTVLKNYQVVFDYPGQELTLAAPGTPGHSGLSVPALIHPITGIVQMHAVINGDSLSFALDNGASYSFSSELVVNRILDRQPDCLKTIGAVGCANIWGWWPDEDSWNIIRVPEITVGSVTLIDIGLVGLPESFPLPAWYSQKTAQPVDGLLGPNAFKNYRVEIDYKNSMVYFQKSQTADFPDMDIIGLTLRPEADGNYSIIGISQKNGEASVTGIEIGDILIKVDDLSVQNSTMGNVIDALRGRPGDTHQLIIKRNEKQYKIIGVVKRHL